MNLEATISGPIETDSDFYLAKGKFEGQDWEGVIQKKGDTGVLVAFNHKKAKNRVGKQKIVSYTGGITAKIEDFKKGAKATFENVGSLKRRPKPEDLKEDLQAKLAEQDDVIKRQTANQEKTNELNQKMMDQMAEMQKEIDSLKSAK